MGRGYVIPLDDLLGRIRQLEDESVVQAAGIASLEAQVATGLLIGVAGRIPGSPSPTDPIDVVVPAATETPLPIWRLNNLLTIHDQDAFPTFEVINSTVFRLNQVTTSLFTRGIFGFLLDFSDASTNAVWTFKVQVGGDLGGGGETILQQYEITRVVRAGDLRGEISATVAGLGPDDANAPVGGMEMRVVASHNSGAPRTLQVNLADWFGRPAI